MASLLELAGQAQRLAEGGTLASPEDEVARVLQICNACRYCEGFCAVFPAMTRRLEFPAGDVHYLANLCHGCGACLHACQYAPPHEFAVNVPQAMARVRVRTYQHYAWPQGLASLYARHGLKLSLITAAALALFLVLLLARAGTLLHEPLQGNFYKIFPHGLMAGMFGAVGAFAALAIGIGLLRFWREVGAVQGPDREALARMPQLRSPAAAEAVQDALRLKYLGDCNNEDDAISPWRRRMHHLVMYGFLLCFASTSLATVYHYGFGWHAPYALLSLPVILGTLGGLGLCIGTVGLGVLRRRRHPLAGAAEQGGLDAGFTALLFLVAFTGLALLALRDTGVMGLLLAIHLGVVMALFLTLPYGKFVHGFYRLAALLKHALERRLPSHLRLGGD